MSTTTQASSPAAGHELLRRDAIVVGGNMAGITLAYLLGQYGYDTTLVERAPFLGGIDGSFRNPRGRFFDFGVHALDHGRNEFVSRLFERAVNGRFRRLPKRRSLLLRGHLIPYNAPPEEWPDELRALMKTGPIVDDIGSDPPTRARLGEVYGSAFADFIFDEVLASYPAEDRQREYGIDESRLLANIYPWFCPRVERVRREDTTHHRYQSKVRAEGGEHVIYPEEGGFEGFALGLAEAAREAGVEVLVGARDFEVHMDADRRRVEHLVADGRRYTAPRVYWCGPPKALLDLMGEEPFDATPETFVLASLQFERPVQCDDLELIGGDPKHLIKRASFPGKLQGGPDDLVQIEYHYPRSDGPMTDGGDDNERAWWAEQLVGSLRAIGVVDEDNELLEFDLKRIPMHYNGFGIEGKPVPKVAVPDLPPDSNLRPVLPSYQKININTRLPLYLRYLAEDLTR